MQEPSRFQTVLVANRGEIACRIIRTVQAQGLRAVAIYSDADADAPHRALANDAVRVGPGPAKDSYLNAPRILDAAERARAEAIHPGYGFLSENADFADAVAAAGLTFIGPPGPAIRNMGDKAEAKRIMLAAGVPCVPGYHGTDQGHAALLAAAQEIGFPLMVKAAAGGGGRGMRLVTAEDTLAAALDLARSEAEAAFGADDLILERAILDARHVEVQVFADAYGNVIHLGERDCSVQRRHQKVVEEAPCPAMTPKLRAQMGQAAVDAARAVDYRGAGTVEFLLDQIGAFYFLEMNTRLQVEHPVTELVTGLDLVALQLSIAQGAPLPVSQEDVTFTGHAIEARLYAEDPTNDYLPATGQIDLWRPAAGPGVRIDDGIRSGQQVSPFYDPMLAKIIAHGSTREVARQRLIRAVEGSALLGVTTNSAFLADVLAQPHFAEGQVTTGFIAQTYPNGFTEGPISDTELALAAALLGRAAQTEAMAAAGYVSAAQLGWTSGYVPPADVTLTGHGGTWTIALACVGDSWQVGLDGQETPIHLRLGAASGPERRADVDGQIVDVVVHQSPGSVSLAIGARRLRFDRLQAGGAASDPSTEGRLTAPMPGLVVSVSVEAGQTVRQGQVLLILEAMKMQHQIIAPFDGTALSVHVADGDQVSAGDALIELAYKD